MLHRDATQSRRCSSTAFAGGIGADAQLRTPCGTRRAEMVRPGDLIVTRENGLQPVRMVWRKRLTRADMTAGSGRAPVRLKPRSIGPMMPARDLLVAADHRIVVPGYRVADADARQSCLISAGEFASASDEAYEDRSTAGVELYTFVFDTHQVFSANGLPVESFLPNSRTISALTERLRRELTALFPVLRKDPEAYPATNIPQIQGHVRLAETVI